MTGFFVAKRAGSLSTTTEHSAYACVPLMPPLQEINREKSHVSTYNAQRRILSQIWAFVQREWSNHTDPTPKLVSRASQLSSTWYYSGSLRDQECSLFHLALYISNLSHPPNFFSAQGLHRFNREGTASLQVDRYVTLQTALRLGTREQRVQLLQMLARQIGLLLKNSTLRIVSFILL